LIRRAGVFLLGFVFLAFALGTIAVWLVSNALALQPASPILRVASVAILLVALVGLSGGGRVLRRFAAPVVDVVEAAQRIEAGDLTARVTERGPRNFRSVARAFNAMTTELQASDERRRQFLADVSHELRTPLSVIRGRAEGIIDGVYPGDAEHVSPILESARTLELLIEDLRTLALAEAGGLTLRRECLDLGVLINETLSLFDEAARERRVKLSAVTGNLPAVQADPARLQSVFSNLVSNALRHTPPHGAVVVSARGHDEGIEVAVSDSGEGIPADILPRVFDRFVKGQTSTGSGLGLAIARDLVVAHGGRITAASPPGGGATIAFWLPAS